MEIVISGFILGLMGSFHCIGMCGPIALSLPLKGESFLRKIAGGVLYNLGRTFTYGSLGGVFGLIGQGLHLAGFQQWVSVIMGGVMILTVLIPSVFRSFGNGANLPFSDLIRRRIGNLFAKRSYSALFLIGLLNGLLPCGLVYLAIAGAIGTSDIVLGVLFMVLFGLGTLPMLLGVSLLGNLITVSVRNKINKLIPALVVTIGILFVLRGLSLGIPYISPPAEKLSPQKHVSVSDSSSSAKGHRSCCGSD